MHYGASDPLYVLAGRAFTMTDLKRSIILASGGKLTDLYVNIWDLDLWEIIEAIELVTDINKTEDSSSKLWDMLNG